MSQRSQKSINRSGSRLMSQKSMSGGSVSGDSQRSSRRGSISRKRSLDNSQSQDFQDDLDNSEEDEVVEEIDPFEEISAEEIRKIKLIIEETFINSREENEKDPAYEDLILGNIAQKYGEFLCDNDEDEEYLKTITQAAYNKDEKDLEQLGKVEAVSSKVYFEKDFQLTPDFIKRQCVEAGSVLVLEMQDTKDKLQGDYNNYGCTIQLTREYVVIVFILAKRQLAITQITNGETEGNIEVLGKVLDFPNIGLAAATIYNSETKEVIKDVDAEHIQFDPESLDFQITFACGKSVGIDQEKLGVELFIRPKGDKIKYGKPMTDNGKIRKEVISFLDKGIQWPCQQHPNLEHLEDDDIDRNKRGLEKQLREKFEDQQEETNQAAREERSKQRKYFEDEVKARKVRLEDVDNIIDVFKRNSQRSKLNCNNLVEMSQGFAASIQQESLEQLQQMQDEENAAQEDSQEEEEEDVESSHASEDEEEDLEGQDLKDGIKEPTITNREIKKELEQAIEEATAQKNQYEAKNRDLQLKIIKIREQRGDHSKQTQSDGTMNTHKYYNTLAHVHQIRLDLTKTQERYNKMADQLQKKLNEKQKKCNELNMAFMELKREVAKKAANSRTDKPIDSRYIESWQVREQEKTKQLQGLRLEILKLRNQYQKNLKIYKQKEELADGLHLIDFEQLKIENQTLNEKIEERNENLHKLQRTNTQTVQILTHTKEKLYWFNHKNYAQQKKLKTKSTEVKNNTSKSGLQKQQYTRDRKKRDKLKEETGIFNKKELLKDYSDRIGNRDKLQEMKEKMLQKLKKMQQAIDHYRRLTQGQRSMMSTNRR